MSDSFASDFGRDTSGSFFSRHKRSTIVVASAFAAAGAITTVAVHAQTSDSTGANTTSLHATVQTADDQSGSASNLSDPTDSTSSTSVNASVNAGVSGNSNNVQLSVNGQDIAVPPNGTTQQTVPNPDGSGQTSVNVTSGGSASNTSNSSVNLNVSSSSSSSSGSGFSSSSTMVMQNGGTTFITSN